MSPFMQNKSLPTSLLVDVEQASLSESGAALVNKTVNSLVRIVERNFTQNPDLSNAFFLLNRDEQAVLLAEVEFGFDNKVEWAINEGRLDSASSEFASYATSCLQRRSGIDLGVRDNLAPKAKQGAFAPFVELAMTILPLID